jgi:broad specificity phosphatase PhoE
MAIHLIRHGESLANSLMKHQGGNDEWNNTSLSDEGVLQAKMLSESLEGKDISYLFSSPLKRARQTAESISYKGNIIFNDDIIEQRDDETIEIFIKRVKRFWNKIKDLDGEVYVVSHAGVILTLLAITTGDRKKGGDLVKKYFNDIDNTSITKIMKKDDVYTLEIGIDTHRKDKKDVSFIEYDYSHQKIYNKEKDILMKLFPESKVYEIGSFGLSILGRSEIDILLETEDIDSADKILRNKYYSFSKKGYYYKKYGKIYVKVYAEKKNGSILRIYRTIKNNPDLIQKFKELKELYNASDIQIYEGKKRAFLNSVRT